MMSNAFSVPIAILTVLIILSILSMSETSVSGVVFLKTKLKSEEFCFLILMFGLL